jgi:hypothetical protein
MQQSYSAEVERTLHRLRMLVRRLGSHGGATTPSEYETAQTLRFCPQLVNRTGVVAWLLRRQHADGGWGDADAPLYRIVPTLAATLALHEQGEGSAARRACLAGLRYLAGQHDAIDPECGQFLPIAIELILPRLLDEADCAGLHLPRTRFRHIEELNVRRRAVIAAHPPPPNGAPMFSWEAWGEEAAPELVGATGGVGHSPAATAWWLRLDSRRPDMSAAGVAARTRALAYLRDASRALPTNVLGVVPSPWPINRFEQSFGLHILVTAGLATRHELALPFLRRAADLNSALTSKGIGFSDGFVPDGDDTAAALGVTAAAGLMADSSILAPFRRADHFVAYPHELHASHTVTARATEVLATLGCDVTPWRRCVAQAQRPDGWWNSEKWNRSCLYGTHVALTSLAGFPSSAKRAAARAYLDHQNADGGWGSTQQSTLVETAYGLLALCRIAADSEDASGCRRAIAAAHEYLRRNEAERGSYEPRFWISKDLFGARRVERAIVLSALLAPHFAPGAAEASDCRQQAAQREGVTL